MLKFALLAEINKSPQRTCVCQGHDKMISRHGSESQEATYFLQLALLEWERKARKAHASC